MTLTLEQLTTLGQKSKDTKSAKRQSQLIPLPVTAASASDALVHVPKWMDSSFSLGYCDLKAIHRVKVKLLRRFWGYEPCDLVVSKSLFHKIIEAWNSMMPDKPLGCNLSECHFPIRQDQLHTNPAGERSLQPISKPLDF